MADALTERTARLLADYLEYCAREPGTAGRPPSTPEASLLRSVAAQVQQRNHQFLSQYRDYRGNRVELVAQTARELAGDRGVLSWGRVVALVTFAGTLLERTPRGTDGCPKPGPRREADVDPDCRSMVALLCGWLSGQHGAWLEASGGWVSARGAGTPGGAGSPERDPVGRWWWQDGDTRWEVWLAPLGGVSPTEGGLARGSPTRSQAA